MTHAQHLRRNLRALLHSIDSLGARRISSTGTSMISRRLFRLSLRALAFLDRKGNWRVLMVEMPQEFDGFPCLGHTVSMIQSHYRAECVLRSGPAEPCPHPRRLARWQVERMLIADTGNAARVLPMLINLSVSRAVLAHEKFA